VSKIRKSGRERVLGVVFRRSSLSSSSLLLEVPEDLGDR